MALEPSLSDDEYVFCSLPQAESSRVAELDPLSVFVESEGVSLILEKRKADAAEIGYESVFRCITLQVYSSLDSVGLTAAVAGALTDAGISANVVAAYHHDHVFVPAAEAMTALEILRKLSRV